MTTYILYSLQWHGFWLSSNPSLLRGIVWNKTFPKLILSCLNSMRLRFASRFWDFQRFLITTRVWLLWNSIYCSQMSSFFPPLVSIQISVLINFQRRLWLQLACQRFAQYPKNVYSRHPLTVCMTLFLCLFFGLTSFLYKSCYIFERILVHISLWNEGEGPNTRNTE